MKKSKIILIIIGVIFIPIYSFASEIYVNGYYKSDGSYVEGYYRTSPDNDLGNNYGYSGNTRGLSGSVTPKQIDATSVYLRQLKESDDKLKQDGSNALKRAEESLLRSKLDNISNQLNRNSNPSLEEKSKLQIEWNQNTEKLDAVSRVAMCVSFLGKNALTSKNNNAYNSDQCVCADGYKIIGGQCSNDSEWDKNCKEFSGPNSSYLGVNASGYPICKCKNGFKLVNFKCLITAEDYVKIKNITATEDKTTDTSAKVPGKEIKTNKVDISTSSVSQSKALAGLNSEKTTWVNKVWKFIWRF